MKYEPKPGDIFACWGTDLVSRGISVETSLTSWLTGPNGLRLSPSHVAIVCSDSATGQTLHWYESTTMAPRSCLAAGRRVSGVQEHAISSRIGDYLKRGGHVVVYRLTDFDALTPGEILQLWRMLCRCVGSSDGSRPATRYDTKGAAFSGTRVWKWLPFSSCDRDAMFCSELIAALLQRLCRMTRRNPEVFHPGSLLRTLVRQGTYYRLCDFRTASEVVDLKLWETSRGT